MSGGCDSSIHPTHLKLTQRYNLIKYRKSIRLDFWQMALTSAIILIICQMGDSIGFRQKMDIFDQDG